MKHLWSGLVLIGLAAPAVADGPSLTDARQRWLRGNYEEAREQFEALRRQPATQAAATIGLSRVCESVGDYEQALGVLDQPATGLDRAAITDILARRAELQHLRGRWDEAIKTAEQVLALQKDHLLARWVRAQVYRDRGDLKQADAECRWFVRTYNDRLETPAEIKDPAELAIVGQAVSEYARWHALAEEFRTVLNDIYGDALRLDKDYWPAECLAGMLLLEKYNRPEALEAFDKALKINASAAEAHVGKGLIALQKFELQKAEELARQALASNPKLPAALRLRADVHLFGGDFVAALKDLDAARQLNPRDESTLGRVAACLLLQKKQAEFDALAAEVEKHDAKPAQFYFELAERLENRRQFGAAETYLKKAIALRPMLADAQNSLGLLYMRLGREPEARAILDKAFDADPFNVQVANTRKVLLHLDRYETLKTDHFELRFDPKNDAVLARYMAEYLETLYHEYAKLFQYEPPGPILIELFNNHEMFSGRVVALPDLHTIGACTGKMVAMVSPRGKGVGEKFNWARVVRHELVHIFNLVQTDYQCPHWLTEGLAVNQEGFARPQMWNELLRQRVPAGELMNLDTIDLGFIRPESQAQWHLAYCQSQLYVNYLREKFGAQSTGELLAAYRDGLGTSAAIAKVCKVDRAAFEKGYRAYVEAEAAKIKGGPARKTWKLAELQEKNEQDPDNTEIAALLAEQYLARARRTEARKLADGVLARDPTQPLASYVKAELLLAGGDADGARKTLEAGRAGKPPEPKLFLRLGRLCFDAEQFAEAEKAFEQGRQLEPLDSNWLKELARVHNQSGQKPKLIAVLRELAPADADDLEVPRKLAGLLLDAGQPADAERYARQALEVDLLDGPSQDALLKALADQKKDAEAERLRKLLGK
jgi:tetratricopeptide (TPR) repeat protein